MFSAVVNATTNTGQRLVSVTAISMTLGQLTRCWKTYPTSGKI